jgi:hypothetical protein
MTFSIKSGQQWPGNLGRTTQGAFRDERDAALRGNQVSDIRSPGRVAARHDTGHLLRGAGTREAPFLEEERWKSNG